MGESKLLATEGQVAYRVTAGQISRPLRLAKAGDTKKAPGPSGVLPHQVGVLLLITPPPPQFGMSITRTHPWGDMADIRLINDVSASDACVHESPPLHLQQIHM